MLILTVFMTAFLVFTSAVGLGPTGTGAAKNIKRGLDLSGGVSITYEASKKNPTDDEMSDTIYKLQKRVENYSSEAQVYKEGDNRINVEIPDVTDANAILEELGTPGSLYFIAHKGSDGTENYSTTDGVTYTLNKTIEELEKDGSIVLTGTDVKTASAQVVQDDLKNNTNVVDLTLTKDGTDKFAEATKAAYEDSHDSIGIYYDGEFVSVPSVNAEIKDGKAQISGMKNAEEAESLASTIRIGGLKLELKELRSNVVAAQLGEEAISSSLKAAAIGLVIVMIFMIVQYLVPGVVAAFALAIYTTLVIATLYLFEITLTLPGIAGIILSIGMAVDANVIIFARIREEIADGKSVATAIETGFARARSAILDGNITTLIAAAVLGLRGSGTVKGFASTLAIGIILSMFTCMVVTKVLMHAVYAIGVRDAKFYGKAKERKPFDFVGKTGIFIAISCAIIVCGCVGVGMHKSSDGTILNYSLEFKGGTSTAVVMDKQYSIKEIDKEIVPLVEKITGDGNVQAQAVEGTKQIIIKTRTLSLEERTKLEKTMTKNFGVDKKDITSESISSTVSNEMKTDAIVAVVIATICMLLYIWFRFKDVRFAGSAVIALSHDVIMVFICYVLAWISVGNTFIACMLTIIGYSINNTIVIFDRIRDALKKHHAQTKAAYKEIVNKSIAQTMSRSVNTSITTFVMVLVLYIMGVTSIREFALPLMVGLLAGTYSSICLASEIWYLLRTKGMKKE